MEEVINKSDGQFKDILDDLVDYSKHESKKDPIIKELNRSKRQPPKPAASLNSSTYSSAASSLSSNTSSSSSTTSSHSSSTSTSPKQTKGGRQHKKSDPASQKFDKLEIAEMQELGKTAKILRHHRFFPLAVNSISNPKVALQSQSGSNIVLSGNTSSNIKIDRTALGKGSASSLGKYFVSELSADANGLGDRSEASQNWKTINCKRDKRRKKPVEKKIFAGEIPGNIGKRSVEELETFIKSGTKGSVNNKPKNKQKNNKNRRQNPSNNVASNTTQSNSTTRVKKTEQDSNAKSHQQPTKVKAKPIDDHLNEPKNFNYEQILNYISSAWDIAMETL